MADVHLPGVGGVSKKSLAIGGAAAAALVGLIYFRKRKSSASSSTATDPNATDPNATDPNATGDYLSSGLQDTSQGPTYGATGYYDPNTGQWVYGNTGTGQAAATTNSAWAQNAISFLSGAADTNALSVALGAYLSGQSVTTEQEALIDQAIAVEGYPPVSGAGGYPPGIRVSDTGTGAGGTGGSGGGVTGSGGGVTGSGSGGSAGTGTTGSGGGARQAGAISNLRVTGYNHTGVSFAWNPAPGATGYAWKLTGNGITKSGNTTATHVSVTGLTRPGVYNFGVQGLPGGPGNNIHTPSLKG